MNKNNSNNLTRHNYLKSLRSLTEKLVISFIFLSFLVTTSNALAATWYVDNAASGSNNGTSWTNAWQSFSAIGWSSVQPGDTVYISGGASSKTYSGQLTIGASGTLANPIVVKVGQDTGHNGQAILDGGAEFGIAVGGNSWITISGQLGSNSTPNMIVRNHSNDEIQLSNITGVVIEYLEVGPNVNDECIDVINNYIGGSNRIHHNKIHNCYDYGIKINPPSGTPTHDKHLRIDNNEFYNLGHDAIHAGARAGGLTLDHNDIHTANSGPNQSPSYIDGMHLRGFNYLTVAYNKIHDLEGPDGMWSYLYFEADTSQSDVEANDIYVYNNVIYETIRDYSDQNIGISFGCKACSSLSNVRIVNNTIIDVENAALSFGTYSATVSNVIIANNLIYNGDQNNVGGNNRMLVQLRYLDAPGGVTTGSFNDTPTPDIIWDYNLIDVYGNATVQGRFGASGAGTIIDYSPNWKSACGCDDNGVNSDPTFVNWSVGNPANLRLSSSDLAARNRGRSFSELFSDDFDGNPRSGLWDIGAYEYRSDTTTPRPPSNLTIE